MVANEQEHCFVDQLKVLCWAWVMEVCMANVDDVEQRDVNEELNLDAGVVEEGESDDDEQNSPQDKDYAVRFDKVLVRP